MTRPLLPLRLLLPLLLPLFLSAQTPRPAIPDARLYAVFDSVYLENVSAHNPTLLLRWNFYLDNAFIISDFPAAKGDVAQLPVVQIPDLKQVNILLLEKTQRLARDWEKPVLYRIGDSDKVLMYFSGKDFNQKFRKWLE